MTNQEGQVYPRRSPAVRRRDGSTGTILVTNGADDLVLNDTALALWDLCDGLTSVEEMVEAVNTFFDADPAVIRRDVLAVLGELAARGVLEWRTIPVGGE